MGDEARRCGGCGQALSAAGATCPRCTGGAPAALGRVQGDREWVLPPRLGSGRFEILGVLGRGGNGIVYRVRDRELDDVVALKVLDPMSGFTPGTVERFKKELKIARRIHHPNVARLYDLTGFEGKLAISMELIEGKSLEDLVPGRMPLEELRRSLRYVCSGLQAAHELGIVHRDLKPANILIDGARRAHLVDFGIALLGGLGEPERKGRSVFGTPWYMSPEQIYRPRSIDTRSDLYSLGVAIYRLATGELPFPFLDADRVFRAHATRDPEPPSRKNPALGDAVDRVVLRLLAKAPGDRYQTAREAYRDFAAAVGAGGRGAAAAPPARPPRVLLVDDDRLSRTMVADALRALGAEVREAEDGYQGVERALALRPDLVLLDLLMPVLDGREALRILKSNPRTASIPVVMLTALDDPEEALYSKELGAALYLNKPVAPDVLELVLERHGVAGDEVARREPGPASLTWPDGDGV